MRKLIFDFDNEDVAGRFVDYVMAMPNGKGVIITIPDAASENIESLGNGPATEQITRCPECGNILESIVCCKNAVCTHRCC